MLCLILNKRACTLSVHDHMECVMIGLWCMLFLATPECVSYIDENSLVHNVLDSNYCHHYFRATMKISTSYKPKV